MKRFGYLFKLDHFNDILMGKSSQQVLPRQIVYIILVQKYFQMELSLYGKTAHMCEQGLSHVPPSPNNVMEFHLGME